MRPSHLGGWGYVWGAQGVQHKGLTEGIGGACAWLVGGRGRRWPCSRGKVLCPSRRPELPRQQEAGETESTGSRLLPTPSRPSPRRHGHGAALGAQPSSHSSSQREFWGCRWWPPPGATPVPPCQADKRAHHNALERKRRDHIKDSFHSLRDSVPSLQGEKVNLWSVLGARTAPTCGPGFSIWDIPEALLCHRSPQ